jgi:hypothetical protein
LKSVGDPWTYRDVSLPASERTNHCKDRVFHVVDDPIAAVIDLKCELNI